LVYKKIDAKKFPDGMNPNFFFTTNIIILNITTESLQRAPTKKAKLHESPRSREDHDDTIHGDGDEGAAGGVTEASGMHTL
jgi:hypothetical protein